MAKLRLAHPKALLRDPDGVELVEVAVAVDVPVIHLDGEYSYLAPKESIDVGMLVKVPFGAGETFGFVTKVAPQPPSSGQLKRISKILVAVPLFGEEALTRYRRLVDLYGASLISLLKLAVPMRRSIKSIPNPAAKSVSKRSPSSADARFLEKLFKDPWQHGKKSNLLVPIGTLWDRIAVSIYLALPGKTLVLVPNEHDLSVLLSALRMRQVSDFIVISGSQTESERLRNHLKLMDPSVDLVVGTRSAAFAPFNPERVVIVDPGHRSYMEQRSPYLRGDDDAIWDVPVITLNHSRTISGIAQGEQFIASNPSRGHRFEAVGDEGMVARVARELSLRSGAITVLVSINDRSFSSGLHCASCRNRSSCDCGFPLHVAKRGQAPSCLKCGKSYAIYSCRYCSGSQLRATRSGGQSWALSLSRSIRGARVIVSDPQAPRSELLVQRKGVTIVIATQGQEPRIVDAEDRHKGYDIIVLMGGNTGFNASTLSRVDHFRMNWARILGLADPNKASFFVDLDPQHPEFQELRRNSSGRGLELVAQERKALALPPYTVLVEIEGEDAVLNRLKRSLETDPLFSRIGNLIFPVLNGRMTIKVRSADRVELMRLLQTTVRIRSARRLPPIRYRVSPEHL